MAMISYDSASIMIWAANEMGTTLRSRSVRFNSTLSFGTKLQ